MTDWRLLTADGVGAAEGLAGDEVLTRFAAAEGLPPTLRLYTYRPHCALVGRFQDLSAELRLDVCAAEGIEVGRRPTGGGAILMGPDQLGVALAMNGRGAAAAGRPRELMRGFAGGLVRGLRDLGITAGFAGKNDLLVEGRKIAGLGIHRSDSGGLLFHASLLVDLDVPLMARVLRTPFRRISSRELAVLARRTTTVRAELRRDLDLATVRERVAAGFAAGFGVRLRPGAPDPAEQAAIRSLAAEKYRSRAWLDQPVALADAGGRAASRTAEGTLEVRVALAGPTLKAVYLRGDFFADDRAIADLEWRLRWHPARRAAVQRTVGEWARTHRERGALAERLVELLVAAVGDAAGATGTVAEPPAAGTAPYGCFVTPGGVAP